MKLGGRGFFNDAVFEGPVNFNYADFAWLNLSKTVWPKVAAKFHMQGMSYKYIRAAPNEPESHRALLELAKEARTASRSWAIRTSTFWNRWDRRIRSWTRSPTPMRSVPLSARDGSKCGQSRCRRCTPRSSSRGCAGVGFKGRTCAGVTPADWRLMTDD